MQINEPDPLIRLFSKEKNKFVTIHLPSGNFILVYDDQLAFYNFRKEQKADNLDQEE